MLVHERVNALAQELEASGIQTYRQLHTAAGVVDLATHATIYDVVQLADSASANKLPALAETLIAQRDDIQVQRRIGATMVIMMPNGMDEIPEVAQALLQVEALGVEVVIEEM